MLFHLLALVFMRGSNVTAVTEMSYIKACFKCVQSTCLFDDKASQSPTKHGILDVVNGQTENHI